jgi:hypothetical protein
MLWDILGFSIQVESDQFVSLFSISSAPILQVSSANTCGTTIVMARLKCWIVYPYVWFHSNESKGVQIIACQLASRRQVRWIILQFSHRGTKAQRRTNVYYRHRTAQRRNLCVFVALCEKYYSIKTSYSNRHYLQRMNGFVVHINTLLSTSLVLVMISVY